MLRRLESALPVLFRKGCNRDSHCMDTVHHRLQNVFALFCQARTQITNRLENSLFFIHFYSPRPICSFRLVVPDKIQNTLIPSLFVWAIVRRHDRTFVLRCVFS